MVRCLCHDLPAADGMVFHVAGSEDPLAGWPTLMAICLIVVWLTLPLGIQYLLAAGFNIELSGTARYLWIFSPTVVIRRSIQSFRSEWNPRSAWAFYLANAAFYGFLLWLFRHISLKDADQRLGRTTGAVGLAGHTNCFLSNQIYGATCCRGHDHRKQQTLLGPTCQSGHRLVLPPDHTFQSKHSNKK